ncbi:MAG: FG-GAP repeat protein, partial [Gemmatimonadota bacterium]|nr:FG-GAP repeat protein [Gemmatimonadota bacterium]
TLRISMDGRGRAFDIIFIERLWRSVFSMVVIAIVAGLVWTATATAQKQFTLTASDADDLDNFGWSVSVSGIYAIVGATEDDDGNNSGIGYGPDDAVCLH